MLGFSFQKLLVLAGIIGAVWYAYKLVGRMQAARDTQQGRVRRGGGFTDGLKRWSERVRGGAGEPKASQGAEEMVACKVCGTYVSARGARACGRPDCPY